MAGLVLFFAVPVAVTTAPVGAETLAGVNETNVGWLPASVRASMFAEMGSLGVRSVRITLTPPFDQSLAAVAQARAAGLGVLLNINPNFAPFQDRKVPGRKLAHTTDWPLSRFSPSLFGSVVTPLWGWLEDHDLKLDGVEFGNEINWAGYNADLAANDMEDLGNSGRVADLAEGSPFIRGLKRYVEGLRVLHTLRDASRANARTPIVTAGLATVSRDQALRTGMHYVSPVETMGRLRAFGVSDLADGYGIHFYPDLTHSKNGNWDAEGEALSFCRGSNRPCWVSEMGLALPANSCLAPTSYEVVLRTAMAPITTMILRRQIAALYLFDWEGVGDVYAVHRCGMLLPGVAAVLNARMDKL
jgi:hypothetical protein